ncbi:hypothetical protein L5F20_10130 [Aliarcobacter butzleri]|nr:hypothetical protein [Aliarcobacter butzleri]
MSSLFKPASDIKAPKISPFLSFCFFPPFIKTVLKFEFISKEISSFISFGFSILILLTQLSQIKPNCFLV